VCGRCGGAATVTACIKDQNVIDNILAHLREKEQDIAIIASLTPGARASPETLPLFAGKRAR
jgi:hypothetical protein